uniref:C-type lectin domain-containing protein n=1 Tax=Sciurus vulgaris TaxID=55149 RepID=A0A8D2CRQ2_SCIVU
MISFCFAFTKHSKKKKAELWNENISSSNKLYSEILLVSGHLTMANVYLLLLLVVVSILAKTTKPILENPVFATCPKDWIGFGSKCFYFSEDIGNWTFSQTFCASLEASLVQFESQEELNFLIRYKGLSDHWIGLNRESSHHIWKWTDKTEYKASFSIKGDGECAYLNDNGISSARHYTDRKWICSRPISYVHKCGIMSGSSK